jgi:hypothetical protein
MTTDVIEKVFKDPAAATLTIHNPPWRPYSRALMLLPGKMPTGESITKRGRGEESYIHSSYAIVVNNNFRNDSVTTLTTDDILILISPNRWKIYRKPWEKK